MCVYEIENALACESAKEREYVGEREREREREQD